MKIKSFLTILLSSILIIGVLTDCDKDNLYGLPDTPPPYTYENLENMGSVREKINANVVAAFDSINRFGDSIRGFSGKISNFEFWSPDFTFSNGIINSDGAVTLDSSYVTQMINTEIILNTDVYSVKNFGAIGNGITDDTEAIQSAIDAANSTGWGGVVYIPEGTYIISSSLLVEDNNGIVIRGEGKLSSIIRNTGVENSLILKATNWFRISNLYFEGDGGAYGENSSNGYGILLDNACNGIIDNVTIRYNGGGIKAQNGVWSNVISNSYISHNLKNGLHLIADNTQDNTGQINAFYINGTKLLRNGENGLEWAGINLNFTGNVVEYNKSSGIKVGSKKSTSSTMGFYITGNYFEHNDSSQIKLISAISPYRSITGGVIEGNYLFSNKTGGDTAMITHATVGTYKNSLRDTKITNNYYYFTGGYITNAVSLQSPDRTVIVQIPQDPGNNKVTMSSGNLIYSGVTMNLPEAIVVTAGDGIYETYPVMGLDANSPIDITANPQIINGEFNGQIIELWGYSDINTIKLDEGNGLKLSGGNSFIMGENDGIAFIWSEYDNLWVEKWRTGIVSGGSSDSTWAEITVKDSLHLDGVIKWNTNSQRSPYAFLYRNDTTGIIYLDSAAIVEASWAIKMQLPDILEFVNDTVNSEYKWFYKEGDSILYTYGLNYGNESSMITFQKLAAMQELNIRWLADQEIRLQKLEQKNTDNFVIVYMTMLVVLLISVLYIKK